jgi:hypothetical protein
LVHQFDTRFMTSASGAWAYAYLPPGAHAAQTIAQHGCPGLAIGGEFKDAIIPPAILAQYFADAVSQAWALTND